MTKKTKEQGVSETDLPKPETAGDLPVKKDPFGPRPPGGWNPSGRQAAVQNGMIVLETAAQRAAKQLVELLEHDSAPVRLAAIREINDRVYGKPKQQVDVQVQDVAKLHLQYLQEIQARREERMKVIDGTPEKKPDDT